MNRHLLSSRPFVWVGLISYPLYLWHWPLLAFARILLAESMSSEVAAALAAVSIVLAWLTYRLVESPLRASRRSGRALRDAVVLWSLTAAMGMCGLAAWRGWLQPRSASMPTVRAITTAQCDWLRGETDELVGSSPERVLFVGDSHMQQYWPRIQKIVHGARAPVYSVRLKTEPGCAPLGGIERKAMHCSSFVDEALAQALEPSVKTVVLAASWYGFSIREDYYGLQDATRKPLSPYAEEKRWVFAHWAEALRGLKRQGKRVVLVLSSPRGPSVDPARLIDRRTLFWIERPAVPVTRTQLHGVVAAVDARILEVARTVGAEVVDPFDWLCGPESCPVMTANGEPIFKDDSHLRASFVRDHVPMLDRFVYLSGERPSTEKQRGCGISIGLQGPVEAPVRERKASSLSQPAQRSLPRRWKPSEIERTYGDVFSLERARSSLSILPRCHLFGAGTQRVLVCRPSVLGVTS